MSLSIGIGYSQKDNTAQATQEAFQTAKNTLQSLQEDLVIVLSTIHYDPKEVSLVANTMTISPRVIGSSTAGFIVSSGVITHGIAVLIVASETLQFGLSEISSLDYSDPLKAGEELASECLKNLGQSNRNAFLLFADGLYDKNNFLLQGIQNIVGNVFPIIGAGSCDDFSFKKTYHYYQDRVLHNSSVGLVLGGGISVAVGSRHGWRPLGKPRTVTSVKGNIIQTIDEKNAFQMYYDYFQEATEQFRAAPFSKMSILYPLGISIDNGSDYLLRNIIRVQDDGSLVCQGDVPAGSEIRIMIRDKEASQQAATAAAEEAKQNLFGKIAKLIIVFESIARLKLLGRSINDELESIKKTFGPYVPIFGMFSNGEICPTHSNTLTKPLIQNESIVIQAIA